MKVLVVDTDNTIGRNVVELLQEQSTIECIVLDKKRVEKVAATIKRRKPTFVINCHTHQSAQLGRLDAVHMGWVEEMVMAAQEVDSSIIHISSSQVFAGTADDPYAESDEPDSDFDMGSYFYAIENTVLHWHKSFVLRAGWVFGAEEGGFLDQLLTKVEQGGEVTLPLGIDGSPTPADDMARVVLAVMWQLHYGADCWGVYHYCGAEITTGIGFVDTLIALASQYGSLALDDVDLVEGVDSPELPRYPLLSCEKIREGFGIRQRPWRAALISAVKQRYQEESADSAI